MIKPFLDVPREALKNNVPITTMVSIQLLLKIKSYSQDHNIAETYFS